MNDSDAITKEENAVKLANEANAKALAEGKTEEEANSIAQKTFDDAMASDDEGLKENKTEEESMLKAGQTNAEMSPIEEGKELKVELSNDRRVELAIGMVKFLASKLPSGTEELKQLFPEAF